MYNYFKEFNEFNSRALMLFCWFLFSMRGFQEFCDCYVKQFSNGIVGWFFFDVRKFFFWWDELTLREEWSLQMKNIEKRKEKKNYLLNYRWCYDWINQFVAAQYVPYSHFKVLMRSQKVRYLPLRLNKTEFERNKKWKKIYIEIRN